jgi:hypothetical protein
LYVLGEGAPQNPSTHVVDALAVEAVLDVEGLLVGDGSRVLEVLEALEGPDQAGMLQGPV